MSCEMMQLDLLFLGYVVVRETTRETMHRGSSLATRVVHHKDMNIEPDLKFVTPG
jgi:hypothetical protein